IKTKIKKVVTQIYTILDKDISSSIIIGLEVSFFLAKIVLFLNQIYLYRTCLAEVLALKNRFLYV
ncbi:hypothetical protein OFM39_36780, partial [Escherichia coli]|nr:hypothetical protein [Escherichia coli]